MIMQHYQLGEIIINFFYTYNKMDKIAASIVYDILVKAGAEETAKQFQQRIPICTSPIPFSSRFVKKITNPPTTTEPPSQTAYDEDFIVLEAMVKYATKSRNTSAISAKNTTSTSNNNENGIIKTSSSVQLEPSVSVTPSSSTNETTIYGNNRTDSTDNQNSNTTGTISVLVPNNIHVNATVMEPSNVIISTPSTQVSVVVAEKPSLSSSSSTLPPILPSTTPSAISQHTVIIEPWSLEELVLFQKALLQFPAAMDTNAHFRAIATVVETRSKRECYDKFKELYPSSSATNNNTNNHNENSSGNSNASTNSTYLNTKSSLSSTEISSSSSSSVSLWEDITNTSTNTSSHSTTFRTTGTSSSILSSVKNNDNLVSSNNVGIDEDGCEVISMDNASSVSSSGAKKIPEQDIPDDRSTTKVVSSSRRIPKSINNLLLDIEESEDSVSISERTKTNESISRDNGNDKNETSLTHIFFQPSVKSFGSGNRDTVPSILPNPTNQYIPSVPLIPSQSTSISSLNDGLWEDIENSNVTSAPISTQQSVSTFYPKPTNTKFQTDLVEEDIIDIDSSMVTTSSNPSVPKSKVTDTNVSFPSSSSHNSNVPLLSSVIQSIPVQTISSELVAQVRMALHGQYPLNASSVPNSGSTTQIQSLRPEWLLQSLQFAEENGLRYGLLQSKGGPCGPLACINAETLRHLYYSPLSSFANSLNPTNYSASQLYDEIVRKCGNDGTLRVSEDYSTIAIDPPSDQLRQIALIFAISDILWRCRPDNTSSVTVAVFDETIARSSPQVLQLLLPLPGSSTSSTEKISLQVSFSSDGITDRLRLYTCTDQKQIIALFEKYISVFTRETGPGLSLILYSAVLTRGILNMLQDMVTSNGGTVYGTTSLVGSYGYASQELVNLLLTGRATSYTFNGKQIMDSTTNDSSSLSTSPSSSSSSSSSLTLTGIEQRSMVGFLSVLHAVGYMEVGTYLREPYTPVWVVFGESHYSVLFAAPLNCTFPTNSTKKRYTFGRKLDPLLMNLPDPSRCIGIQATKEPEQIVQKSFDIIYWDGLARQDELYRLTVKLSSSLITPTIDSPVTIRSTTVGQPFTIKTNTNHKVPTETELSAIELWIWSKYPYAKVTWNDIDPWEPLKITADYLPKYRGSGKKK